MDRRLVTASALLAVVLTAAGCESGTQDAKAAPAGGRNGVSSAGDTGAAATAGNAGGAARGPGGPGAPGGGRRGPMSIVLSPSDVKTVERGTIEASVPINGDLKPIEQVSVRARIEGDLVGVYVREGDRVGRGQVLARFEASEEESGVRSAQADLVAAEGDLQTAQWNADQAEELFKAGAIPERDLKTAQQAVVSAKARVAAAEARVRSTSSSERDTRVLAPTPGTIEQRMVENGEHVARGAVLFTLVRNDVLELAAAVPARHANDVRAGQSVHFSAAGRDIQGSVARVSPTVNPATRALTVYVRIPNADGALKGNTFATGRIVSRSIQGALVIPMQALRQMPETGQPFVYKIDGEVLDLAQVRLGVVDEIRGQAEVLEGLQPGDRIIIGNVGTLGRGLKVQVLGERRETSDERRGKQ